MLVALLLTGCTETEESSKDRKDIPVSLSSYVLSTRAAQNLNVGHLTDGENVAVRITHDATTTLYTYQTDGSGNMTDVSATKAYYPADGSTVDIAACYPATAGTTFSVAADQQSDANYKASDLLFASVSSQTLQTTAVPLMFSHKMSKLMVNATAGGSVGNITGVEILNVKRSVTFNQTTGATALTGSASTITMSNSGAALLPPQTIDGNLLVVHTDKGDATYSVSNKVFEAGKAYTITLVVTRQAVGDVNMISDWDETGFDNTAVAADDIYIDDIPDLPYAYNSNYTSHIVVKDGMGNTLDNTYFNRYTDSKNAGPATAYAIGKVGTPYEGKACARSFTVTKLKGTSWELPYAGICMSGLTSTAGFSFNHYGDGFMKAESSNPSLVSVSTSSLNQLATYLYRQSISIGIHGTTGSATITVTMEDGSNFESYPDNPQTFVVELTPITSIKTLKNKINSKYICDSYRSYQVAANGTIGRTVTNPVGYITYISSKDVDSTVVGSRILVAASTATQSAWGSEDKTHSVSLKNQGYAGYKVTNALRAYGSTECTAACLAWNHSAGIPSGGSTPAHWYLPTTNALWHLTDLSKSTATEAYATEIFGKTYWVCDNEQAVNGAWAVTPSTNGGGGTAGSYNKSSNRYVRPFFAY